MLKFLVEKEFLQIRRNQFLLGMVIMFPFIIVLIYPNSANLEVKQIRLTVVDNDKTTYSQRLVGKIFSSDYFIPVEMSGTYAEAYQKVDNGEAELILEIPHDFEKNLVNGQKTTVFIAADTVNGTVGGMGSSYIGSIIADFSQNIRLENLPQTPSQTVPFFSIIPRFLFNPHLRYPVFMIPALMIIIMEMLCGFLPALNIVTEKEKGTIEQMNVTPVSRLMFIVAKLIPYWVIGIISLSITFVVAYLVYGVSSSGNILPIYLVAALFILSMSGFGLIISNYAQSVQQAMFMMFFFIMMWIYLSGLFTPTQSMPQWAQVIGALSPLKYGISAVRAVYLKGSGLNEIIPQIFALIGFAVFFNSWAIMSYRKTN